MDVEAYLERIGYDGPREPGEQTLAALHRAHMLAVPFENLDIHLGIPNILDPEHVFDKIVARRRGGWCYELNGLFALLLERLGFAVTRYSAAVVVSDPPSPDFAHLTLRVDLDSPWLADVGFGASFTRPLRLDDEDDQERDGNAYRLARSSNGRMALHENGAAQYAFALEPRAMEEFAEMCVLQQTSPGSHFLQAPMCSRATEHGRVSLSGMRLITTTKDGRTERELGSEEERAAALRELFGVDLGGRRIRALEHEPRFADEIRQMPGDEPRTDTIDILRRVAGAAAVHIYEMEWLDDATYRCNEFIGAGVESLIGPIPPGIDEEEAWEAAVHPDDRARYDACGEALQRGEPQEMEYRLVGSDGVTRWVWERARPRLENGRRLVDGIVADVTDRRRSADELVAAQARLEHLAYHDALTDLPNRLLFQEHLEQAIARAHRGDLAVAVLFVDLDDFKLVNDSHGHTTGDELLRVVADRLRDAVRATDVVARLGGDEFLVLVADIERGSALEAADRVAENIHAALRAPVKLTPGELYTHASMGASLYPADAESAEELLSKADIAMYRAKEAERLAQRPAIFSSLDAADQLATVSRLRHALDRDEFVLHYQPLVALGEGRMVGVEALIRWNDGERGLVGPDTFVPLAERAGLIGPISDWVVESACAQVARWRRAGIDLYASVNMPALMWRPAEIQRVLAAIRAADIPADRLMIEITESAAIARPGSLEPVMADLHERGVRVAIDDFGTGHSSLERLSQMRVTTLKIDRSFIAAIPGDRRVSLLVATIVQLAGNLGLEPLAEGVETEAQRRFLVENGCMLGQGFYFSRAVPAEQIAELDARTVRRAA